MFTTELIPSISALAGGAVAALIACIAFGFGALTASGAVAATLTGAAAFAPGWRWAALLVFFFVSSTALSKLGSSRKASRVGGIIAKSGPRDAVQVLANGGAFAVGALLVARSPSVALATGALGALAGAASDTWATELGVLFGGQPRSVRTLRRVAPGTSGGISIAGTLAGIAGAAAIAMGAVVLGIEHAAPVAIAAGGALGMLADSVLGATLQDVRVCNHCQANTERLVHDCGTRTIHVRGIAWLNNDGVNAVSACTAGFMAAALALWGAAP